MKRYRPKKIYRWQISIQKDVPYFSLRECKSKQQWDTTTHLIEEMKLKVVQQYMVLI